MDRVLGLDLGDVRVGVAISDELGIFALPLQTIQEENDEEVLNRITDFTEQWDIVEIVVGWPLNLDGSEGFRCERTQEMIVKMKERYPDIAIVKFDERLSTQEALKKGRESPSRKKSHDLDTQAAQIILQRYLDLRYKNLEDDKGPDLDS